MEKMRAGGDCDPDVIPKISDSDSDRIRKVLAMCRKLIPAHNNIYIRGIFNGRGWQRSCLLWHSSVIDVSLLRSCLLTVCRRKWEDWRRDSRYEPAMTFPHRDIGRPMQLAYSHIYCYFRRIDVVWQGFKPSHFLVVQIKTINTTLKRFITVEARCTSADRARPSHFKSTIYCSRLHPNTCKQNTN